MFNKVKQQVLDKYNMLPAYPHLKAMDDGDGLMVESLDVIKSALSEFLSCITSMKYLDI